jgi:hypothetical protein
VEEIAYRKGWLDTAGLERAAEASGKTEYAEYLRYITKIF